MYVLGILANHNDDKYFKGDLTWQEISDGLMEEFCEMSRIDVDEWTQLIEDFNSSHFPEKVAFRFIERMNEVVIRGMNVTTKESKIHEPENKSTSFE